MNLLLSLVILMSRNDMEFSFSVSEVNLMFLFDDLNNFEIFRCDVSSEKVGMYHQRITGLTGLNSEGQL